MIIRRVKVFGFHKWIDKEFDFRKGFNYVFGLNEAGKSSLQQFIMFVFYGLPPRKRKESYPKTSSRMGGRLEVIDKEYGHVIIERLDGIDNGRATCILSNGEKKDEAWLNERLYKLPKQIYEAIFAFSSLDLHQQSAQTEDELGMTILHIGLTGARNIKDIEMDLEKRLDELFKPTGKIPVMNKQIAKVNKIGERFIQLKNEESNYNQLIDEQIELEENTDKLQNQIDGTIYGLQLLEKQTLILPLLIKYHTIQEQINLLNNIPNILPEQKKRFTFLQDKLLKLEGKRNILINEYQELKIEQENVQQQLPEAEFMILKKLAEKVPSIRERLAVYESRKSHYEKEKGKINSNLSELQVNLTIKELSSYKFPFYLREEWTSLRNEITTAERQIKQSSTENEKLRSELAHLDERIIKVEERIIPLQDKEQYMQELGDSSEEEKTESFTNHEMKESLPKRRLFIKQQKAKRLRQFILIISVTLGAIGILFYKPLLIVVLFLIAFNIWHKREVSEQLDELIELQGELENEPVLYNNEEMKAKEKINEILIEQKYLEKELAQLKQENEEKSFTCIQLDEQLFELEESLKKSRNKQKDYEEEYPFLQSISPSYWTELLSNISNIQKQLDRLVEEEQSLLEEQLNIEKFYDELYNFDEQSSNSIEKGSKQEQLNLLEAIYKEELRKKKSLEDKILVLQKKKKELSEVDEEMNPYRQEKNEILAGVQVQTDKEFLDAFDQNIKRRALFEQIEEIEHSLDQVFPRNEWISYLKTKPTEFILKQKSEKLQRHLKKLQQQFTERKETLSKISYDINRLEKESSFAKVTQEYENEVEALKHYTKEWASYQFLYNLLNETKEMFRLEYLHEVIKKANDYFSVVTEFSYSEILVKENSKDQFMVKRYDGTTFSLKELSRGTLDLFYVSLKLATSEVMATDYDLPFVIDDAFIHFDFKRRKKILEILKKISEHRQVFYFTCISNESHVIEVDEIVKL